MPQSPLPLDSDPSSGRRTGIGEGICVAWFMSTCSLLRIDMSVRVQQEFGCAPCTLWLRAEWHVLHSSCKQDLVYQLIYCTRRPLGDGVPMPLT